MSLTSFYPDNKKNYNSNIYNTENIIYINSGVAEEYQIESFINEFLRKYLERVEDKESYKDSFIYVNVVKGSNGRKSGYSYVYINDKRIYDELMKYSSYHRESKNRGKTVSQYMFKFSQLEEYEQMKITKLSGPRFFYSKDFKNYDLCCLVPPGQLEITQLRIIKKSVKPYLRCERIPYPIQKEDLIKFFEPFKHKHDGIKSYIDRYPYLRFEEEREFERTKLICYVEFDPATDDVLFYYNVLKKFIIPYFPTKFCMLNLVEKYN